MPLPLNIYDREDQKFVETSEGEVAIRIYGVTASDTSGDFPENIYTKRYNEFIESDDGEVAVLMIGTPA